MQNRKQLVTAFLIALAFVILMFTVVKIMTYVATANERVASGEQVYKVVQQDSEGYWYACKAKKTEDGTYVPQSYYDGEDECVVYLKDNVVTQMPKKGDLVTVRMNKYSDEPHIYIAHD